jgi:hypothetical protein
VLVQACSITGGILLFIAEHAVGARPHDPRSDFAGTGFESQKTIVTS